MRRGVLLVAVLALLAGGAVGCEDAEDGPSPTDVVQPASRDEGIQATGTLDGQRVAISRGRPTVVVGDCDANDGLDRDLCIVARTINGRGVTLVIENPAVLVPGETITAGTACSGGCDDVTDGVVAEFRIDGEARPVQRGSLTVAEAGPRWIADFDLVLPGGDRLIGTFDVAPTPPD